MKRTVLSVLFFLTLDTAHSMELPVPSGDAEVFIRYYSLRRKLRVPVAELIPLRAPGQHHCKVSNPAKYFNFLPVIKISPRALL